VTSGSTSRRPRSRDGNPSKLRRYKGPDQATRLASAGSGTPAAKMRRRMTRGGRRARCSDASRTSERPGQNARRRSAQSRSGQLRSSENPQGPAGRRRAAWVNDATNASKGEGGGDVGERSKRDRRCDWHRPASAAWQASAEGDEKPQERRPIDHDSAVKRCRLRRASFEAVHSTGPAAPARPAVPERAVAGRSVEAHADVGRRAACDAPSRAP